MHSKPTGSQVKLRIDRNTVFTAITLIVVDEPKDIGGFHKVALIVVELDRSLEPGEQLHASRVVAHQRVDQPRRFVDEVTRARNPIVFEITGTTLYAHHH